MNKKQTILKIESQEYSLIWNEAQKNYYCPELNFYFQRQVPGNYRVYKPHECERECPTSPCVKDIDICYGPSEDDFNCEPSCEICGQLDCVCGEEPEEPEFIPECGEFGNDDFPFPEEPEDKEPEDIDEGPNDRDIDEETKEND